MREHVHKKDSGDLDRLSPQVSESPTDGSSWRVAEKRVVVHPLSLSLSLSTYYLFAVPLVLESFLGVLLVKQRKELG